MEEKQSILAAGAGASTKFVFDHGERIERVENVKDLKNYVERIDEMIERKRIRKWRSICQNGKKNPDQQLHMLRYTLTEQLIHGMEVSNLAYDLARELGYEKEICYELAKAGVLHDIGKVVLENYVEEQDTLVVEEMRFVRTHPTLGYELLQGRGYSDFVMESILYHHENYDGTGYACESGMEKRFRLGRVFCVSAMCTAH